MDLRLYYTRTGPTPFPFTCQRPRPGRDTRTLMNVLVTDRQPKAVALLGAEKGGGSEVSVKVTTWYHGKGLVTKNTYAKYQSSTCNSAKVMAKVKVFVTDRRTARRTDRRTNEI